MITIMSDLLDYIAGLAGTTRKLPEGAFLFHQGDRVRALFMVDDGAVDLVRHQAGGQTIVLQRAAAGSVLAEASIYSAAYHCSAVAAADAELRPVSKARFLQALRDDHRLAELWATHLAHQVQAARYRCETLSRKTVAERLDAWLAWHDGALPDRGEWRSLADQIGVTPEALYRELAKRRD